ncbi:MAG: asparagine synthase B [Vicinamibacterales bacterium]
MARVTQGDTVNVGRGVRLVSAAAGRLRHRGPDGSGLRAVRHAVLAHCRLSIVDVARGGQPLQSEDGRLTLVCNGEIYNHESLRARLTTRHTFTSRSDSEVILHLYEEIGDRLVAALDGMFAFVLTDGTDVLAARDALGIKPLYMGCAADGGLWFASEMKALLGVCSEIEEFPAGHLFTLTGGLRRWFNAPWERPARTTVPFDAPSLALALRAAVEKRLMSDVPFGVLLSGGLDSSLIAAAMRPCVEALHSFSVGVEGAPDLAAARQVAGHLGTHHHEFIYTAAEAVDIVETVIAHLESYDTALLRSAIPTYFASRLASDHVKMVLTGEGADEIFAGYEHFADIDDPDALQRESVRLLAGLHNLNLQRVDRMTMAHGLEGRVPFLDVDLVDRVTAFDPRLKLHGRYRPEKWPLRLAFEGALPGEILWRGKQEFAHGCGSARLLEEHCEALVSDADFAGARRRFPVDTPRSKEAYFYRRIFEELFPGDAPRRTVGRWREADGLREEHEIHG